MTTEQHDMTHNIQPIVNLNLHKQTKTCTFALLTTTYCKNAVSMNISAFYVSLIGPTYYQATLQMQVYLTD